MVRRDVRIVFQDIDGCLHRLETPLPDGPLQTPGSDQAWMLAEIGRAIDDSSVSEVVLNTGRGLCAMDFVVENMACRKLRYLLAEHGAVAFDVEKQEHIDLAAIALRRGLPERAARYTQLGPIRDAISWYNEAGEAQVSAHFGCPLKALPKEANLTLMLPAGVVPKDVSEELQRVLTANQAIDSSKFVYHYSDHYIDVISDVSKGDGALLLLEEWGIAPEEALPMGDGLNDVSMFEVLGAGFCPANAAPGLKTLCLKRSGVVSSKSGGEAALELYSGLARASDEA